MLLVVPMNVEIPISPESMHILARSDRLRGAWDAGPGLSRPALDRLREAARIRSTAASARMAGVKLDDHEIAALLRGEAFPVGDTDEVVGYAAALEQGLPPTGVLGQEDLGRLHATMLGGPSDAPSPWRELELHREMFDAAGRALGRVVPTLPPRYVPEQTERLLTWLELELRERRQHPVLVVATFTLGLIAISPYARGNGRLARLAAAVLLDRAGYRFVPYSSLEARLEARRDEYFDALDRSQARLWTGDADLRPWLATWLAALDEHHETLERSMELEQASASLSPLQRSILDAVREHGSVDAGLLLRATGANRNTLKDNLRRMVDGGLLARTGERRGTRYRLGASTAAATARRPDATVD